MRRTLCGISIFTGSRECCERDEREQVQSKRKIYLMMKTSRIISLHLKCIKFFVVVRLFRLHDRAHKHNRQIKNRHVPKISSRANSLLRLTIPHNNWPSFVHVSSREQCVCTFGMIRSAGGVSNTNFACDKLPHRCVFNFLFQLCPSQNLYSKNSSVGMH